MSRSIKNWIIETITDMMEDEKFEIVDVRTDTKLADCYIKGHSIIVQAFEDFRDVANRYTSEVFTFFCEDCGIQDDLARVWIYHD